MLRESPLMWTGLFIYFQAGELPWYSCGTIALFWYTSNESVSYRSFNSRREKAASALNSTYRNPLVVTSSPQR